jgi:7SK snRNA methylphosphate capping enzyme
MIKAAYSSDCVFKQKKVLEIGCGIGTVSLQIAALYEPKIVIGVDIDPTLISAAIHNMHKVINDEESAALVKQQISKHAGESQDARMLTEEERQKEAKLNELI